jgi:hypothetical protein
MEPKHDAYANDDATKFADLSNDELDAANGGWAWGYNTAVELMYGQAPEWHAMRLFGGLNWFM